MSLSSEKNGFGIWDPEKTYSVSRIQGSKRHRIRNTGMQAIPRQGLPLRQCTRRTAWLPRSLGQNRQFPTAAGLPPETKEFFMRNMKVWIRIWIWIGSCSFRQWLSRCQQKIIFFCFLLFKSPLNQSSKIKSHK